MLSAEKDSDRFYKITGIEKDSIVSNNESVNNLDKASENFFENYYNLAKFAGIKKEDAKFRLSLVIFFVLLTFVFSILLANPFVLLIIPIAISFLYLNLRSKIKKRSYLFEQDYPAFLFASVVKTGIDPLEGLCQTENIFSKDSILQLEVIKTKNKIQKGETEEVAIKTFSESIEHPDLKLFRTAFLLSRKEGSSISSCLQRLTKVTRHRQSFRRRIKSAVAMQKLSSYGIVVSAILIGLMQYITNPEAVKTAISHPVGSIVLIFGVLMMLLGIIWMLLISRIRI